MRSSNLVGLAAATAATSLFLAPTALASPPGDNGTVKIHDAVTDEELRQNEPHVCDFYLQGFGFDAGQQVSWTISEMPPTGTRGTVADSGALVLDASGAGHTEDLALPAGHYSLTWQFEGENGEAKHKVFWSDCAAEDEETQPPTDEESPEDEEEPAGTTPDGDVAEPVEQAGADASDEGDLAATGSDTPVAAVVAGAAALLGIGGYLVFRRFRAVEQP